MDIKTELYPRANYWNKAKSNIEVDQKAQNIFDLAREHESFKPNMTFFH